jgi:hypothetical protein
VRSGGVKILDVELDRSAGEPRLKLLVDRIPGVEELTYQKIPVPGYGFLYVAEKDGYVSFFIWSGRGNDGGFYGDEWVVKVRDEEGVHEELVRGPWSSRAGVVNRFWDRQCMEVTMAEPPNYYEISAAITIEKAEEAIRLKPGLRLLKVVLEDGEIRYVVEGV